MAETCTAIGFTKFVADCKKAETDVKKCVDELGVDWIPKVFPQTENTLSTKMCISWCRSLTHKAVKKIQKEKEKKAKQDKADKVLKDKAAKLDAEAKWKNAVRQAVAERPKDKEIINKKGGKHVNFVKAYMENTDAYEFVEKSDKDKDKAKTQRRQQPEIFQRRSLPKGKCGSQKTTQARPQGIPRAGRRQHLRKERHQLHRRRQVLAKARATRAKERASPRVGSPKVAKEKGRTIKGLEERAKARTPADQAGKNG